MTNAIIQVFENENSTGLDKLKLTNIISVINYKGQGSRLFEIKNLNGITSSTTIQDAIDNNNIYMFILDADGSCNCITGGSGGSGGSTTGSSINLSTATFDNNLSASDNTVQKALNTLDDITLEDITTPYICNVIRSNGTETFNDGDVFGVLRNDTFLINENFTSETPTDGSLPTNDSYLIIPKTGYYRISLNAYGTNSDEGRLMVMEKNNDKCICFVEFDDSNNSRSICSTNIVHLDEGNKIFFKSERTITIYTNEPLYTFLTLTYIY